MNDVADDGVNDPLGRLRALAKSPRGAPLPDKLPAVEIRQEPEVFQPRGLTLDQGHVRTLKKAIDSNGGVLDAVLVIQLGDDAYLIDGHHRLAAYEAAGVTDAIPVVYFQDTLEEAILEAGRANSRAKLTMTSQERRNYAWRLVRIGPANKGGPSKKQIREAASVSDGLIGEMRRVFTKLGAEANAYPQWWEALKVSKGEDAGAWSDEDRAAWEQQRADDLTDQLRKAWGAPPQNFKVAAMALEAYFGGRIRDIAEELRWALDDDIDDEGSF